MCKQQKIYDIVWPLSIGWLVQDSKSIRWLKNKIIESVYILSCNTLLIHLYMKNVTDFRETVINVGSITSRCSGKWAHTHSPKERLDACDFLCWFKPIMLPPADFRLAKIVAEIITSKQKVLPWSIAWRSDFDGAETLGEILQSEGTQRFVRLFVMNFCFNDCCWRDFASSRIFSRRFGSR